MMKKNDFNGKNQEKGFKTTSIRIGLKPRYEGYSEGDPSQSNLIEFIHEHMKKLSTFMGK
jgi:hypothetical protein